MLESSSVGQPEASCGCVNCTCCLNESKVGSTVSRKRKAIRKLRRDILASQVIVALDAKEAKVTPHEIKVLANLNLPMV